MGWGALFEFPLKTDPDAHLYMTDHGILMIAVKSLKLDSNTGTEREIY